MSTESCRDLLLVSLACRLRSAEAESQETALQAVRCRKVAPAHPKPQAVRDHSKAHCKHDKKGAENNIESTEQRDRESQVGGRNDVVEPIELGRSRFLIQRAQSGPAARRESGAWSGRNEWARGCGACLAESVSDHRRAQNCAALVRSPLPLLYSSFSPSFHPFIATHDHRIARCIIYILNLSNSNSDSDFTS